jgi:Zn-dependent peptidase ImmA (M78 family)
MNTTEKGNYLEGKVFELIGEEISNDRFFVKKDNCRLYLKQGYYSKDREKDIIFDISIEVFLPGQNSYSLLILIECKNYNHSVPVSDIEEFYAKIQQVAGANGKGIVTSTNSFQERAFKFSESKGIGLLRYYDRSGLKWVLSRSPSSLISPSYAINELNNAYQGLNVESFKSVYYDCYCYIDEQYTNSLNLFISCLVKSRSEKSFNKSLARIENPTNSNSQIVKYRENLEIEAVCCTVLNSINYKEGEVPVNLICKWLHKEKNLKLTINESSNSGVGEGVLGQITFDPLEIFIFSDSEDNEARQKFTLVHELGHYFLGHSKYMSGENCKENDIDVENPLDVGIKDIMRMEWQANYFASCLLLPIAPFVSDFLSLVAEFELSDKGFGVLYLDNQKCNLDSYYKITDELKRRYKVSRSVLRIRLKKLGLLNESTSLSLHKPFPFSP